jgi:pyrroline-5-carboxylate reductase
MLHRMKPRIAFLGNGNMGWSVLSGALDANVIEPSDVLVVEPDREAADRAAQRGVKIGSLDEASHAAVLVLAVKPQSFQALARDLSPLPARCIVVSVMAGLSSESIRAALGPKAAVVRVMPNMPARIGAGISALCLGAGATEDDLAVPMALMQSVGEVVRVTEEQMYAVTATSGSGPAFVLRMAEAMEGAAIAEGLEPATARTLVQQTLFGTAKLMIETGDDPATLRAAVTSKGGTTAAGLDAMSAAGFDDAVVAAIHAATARGIELGHENS